MKSTEKFVCPKCKKESKERVRLSDNKIYCKECAYQIIFERFINKVIMTIIMMAIAIVLLYYRTVMDDVYLTLLVAWLTCGTRTGVLFLFDPRYGKNKRQNVGIIFIKIIGSVIIGFPILVIQTILSPFETYRMITSINYVRKHLENI